MLNCKNCNTEVTGKYCSNCGQAVNLKRIDGHYLLHEIEHILHFERGFLYTAKELLLRPSKVIKQFITEDRNRLVKPIIFIIITSLAYTLVNQYYKIEVGFIHVEEDKPTSISNIFRWVEAHYGYSNVFFGLFISSFVKLFFRKYNYNFFEILILVCYLIGVQMLLFSFFTVFAHVFHIDSLEFTAIICIIYITWGIANFFEGSLPLKYLKSFCAYILGMLSSKVFLILIGIVIEEFKRLNL